MLLVPVQAEYFALEGVSELLDTVERVRNAFNSRLVVEGVVLTMYDDRTNLARQVAEDIRKHLGGLVYKTVIPRIRLGRAQTFNQALSHDIKSMGAQAYLQLAREFLKRREDR
jgi:chromosome partitioning protein